MEKDIIKAAVKESIVELMATDEGRQAFGPVVFDAVGQYLQSYELDLERTHPDGTVERLKERGDILSFIAGWISKGEGAIRGCQVDAARARDRATETRDMLAAVASRAIDARRPSGRWLRKLLALVVLAAMLLPAGAQAASRPDGKKGLYFVQCLTDGAGCLDDLDITAATTPNEYDLIENDAAIYVLGGAVVAGVYVFDADGTDAESSPTVIRPNDYGTAGVWRLTSFDYRSLPALSDGDITVGTSIIPGAITPAQAKLAAETHGGGGTATANLTADNTYSSTELLAGSNGGATIAQWQTVYFDGTAGEYLLADANAVGAWPAAGIAVATTTDGNPIGVMVSGYARNDVWSWTPGQRLCLSETAGGIIACSDASICSADADCAQVIGQAKESNIVYFNFGQGWAECNGN
ncbi:MAG TPA: hypothetical protein DCZ95_12560 [Verrucomicrobia bacterium]|nr:hypothetical protein [Verrucomicrobiota bacterium]